jgi:hypothetical protein
MHIPGTQAALITRPRTKTNKAKHEQKVKKIINTDIKMREWSHVLTKDITVHVSYNTPALLLVVKSVKSRTCNRWKKRIHIQGKISIVIIIVCPFSTIAITLSVLLHFTASDYPFSILKHFLHFCTFSFPHSDICSLIYGFWLHLWSLQTLLSEVIELVTISSQPFMIWSITWITNVRKKKILEYFSNRNIQPTIN